MSNMVHDLEDEVKRLQETIRIEVELKYKAQTLLGLSENRVWELENNLKRANSNMEEMERNLYLRIGELEDKVEELTERENAFRDDAIRLSNENSKLKKECRNMFCEW